VHAFLRGQLNFMDGESNGKLIGSVSIPVSTSLPVVGHAKRSGGAVPGASDDAFFGSSTKHQCRHRHYRRWMDIRKRIVKLLFRPGARP
jgi:hypothetical protein